MQELRSKSCPVFLLPLPGAFPTPPQSCKRSENSKSPNPEHPKEKKTFLFGFFPPFLLFPEEKFRSQRGEKFGKRQRKNSLWITGQKPRNALKKSQFFPGFPSGKEPRVSQKKKKRKILGNVWHHFIHLQLQWKNRNLLQAPALSAQLKLYIYIFYINFFFFPFFFPVFYFFLVFFQVQQETKNHIEPDPNRAPRKQKKSQIIPNKHFYPRFCGFLSTANFLSKCHLNFGNFSFFLCISLFIFFTSFWTLWHNFDSATVRVRRSLFPICSTFKKNLIFNFFSLTFLIFLDFLKPETRWTNGFFYSLQPKNCVFSPISTFTVEYLRKERRFCCWAGQAKSSKHSAFPKNKIPKKSDFP